MKTIKINGYISIERTDGMTVVKFPNHYRVTNKAARPKSRWARKNPRTVSRIKLLKKISDLDININSVLAMT